jgi:hypothetical protein
VDVADDLWATLISSIEDGEVVPVVGPELLIVADGDRQVPLYKLIAERLAAKYDLKPQWREGAELNDVVCSYLDEKPRAVEALYKQIPLILKSLQLAPPEPLLKLASIPSFDLFVSATFDSLLVDALNQVRFAGSPVTKQIAYAPNKSESLDLPAQVKGDSIVFHLFGKVSGFSDYAIHEEDYLEFVHRIETGPVKPDRLLEELKMRHRLFIGCEFADWLNRFVIRLANKDRLRIDRDRTEYIVSRESSRDRGGVMFLTRFSSATQVLDLSGPQFVDELVARWNRLHPAVVRNVVAQATGTTLVQPSARGAIFISYVREDQPAAEALRAAVANIGGDDDICWFDKSSLRPGDPWEEEILSSIERAQIFMPLISRNTELRWKGVVFEEWRCAIEAQKRRSFRERRFIVPVVVDPDFQGEVGNYKNIPKEFHGLHVSRAPEGSPDESLSSMLKEEIRRMRR